jgi:2-polyprenyl-6-methoxyphenol hydroxylase-like FAD-dependent oxidoreductase
MSTQFDLIVVGGGLAGATLARHMAKRGARVLVLERERKFKDRIRGEFLTPWGTAEAGRLGVLDLLRNRELHEVPWVDFYNESQLMVHRELPVTTPQGMPCVSFFHPYMQEILIAAAKDAGADVRRDVSVRDVRPGSPATVIAGEDGQIREYQGRLVVGADGRSSVVRSSCGFEQKRDAESRMIAGLIMENVNAPDSAAHICINSRRGEVAAIFPQGKGKARVYFCYENSTHPRFQGEDDIERFVEACRIAGVNPEFFAQAVPTGPLATFSGAQTWVEHPYRDGVVLIGDAAAASDPSWGQGLALTLRDVRVLVDHLAAAGDWQAAGNAYGEEHDRYTHVMHVVDNWYTEFYVATGPEADQRRARAMPLIAQNPMRQPDHMFSGPEMPFGEEVRRAFFAEDSEAAGAA